VSQPLDELHFQWLYSQVADIEVTNPTNTYWDILRQLYTKEFVWIVPNDDNRVEDGRDLRFEFADQQGLTNVDPNWMEMGCSVLELMIGLSRRLAFEAEGQPRDWFWVLMRNLELDCYNDRFKIPTELVEEILDRLIFRTYDYNGYGGLFPLSEPHDDQRKVEIWYQLSAYVLERT
jgi:hypothetical protein